MECEQCGYDFSSITYDECPKCGHKTYDYDQYKEDFKRRYLKRH